MSAEWKQACQIVAIKGTLLFLLTSVAVFRSAVAQGSRINNPCAGGNPAVLLYSVHSPERASVSNQLLQSYFIVSQAIAFIDSLLKDYTQLNRVSLSPVESQCHAPVACDISYHLRSGNQFNCVQQTYERLASDIIMIEKISQAESDYGLVVNTSLSYQMNRLKETMYNLLCDLANIFEKKRVQLPNLVLRHDTSIFLRDLERFQRDYTAFICIRGSLTQILDNMRRLENVGFFA